MRRSSTPFLLLPSRPERGPASARLRLAARFACVAALVTLAGCVTRGTFDRVEGERNALAADKRRLEDRVRMLEASTESLDSERVKLIEEMEGLRQAHDALDSDVKKLRKAEADLTENLNQRDQELASRSQEVDKLKSTDRKG